LGAQTPLLQHPPLQRFPKPHDVVHCMPLHAVFMGQALVLKHPHDPDGKQSEPLGDLPQSPPFWHPHAPFVQTAPCGAVVQSLHACPDCPQVAGLVSSSHVPAEEQQRFEPHVASPGAPHAFTQAPAAEHVGACSGQPLQALPSLPQAPLAVPGWQLAPSQQPPWHIAPPEHDVEQT
jgi:hypothetical protein